MRGSLHSVVYVRVSDVVASFDCRGQPKLGRTWSRLGHLRRGLSRRWPTSASMRAKSTDLWPQVDQPWGTFRRNLARNRTGTARFGSESRHGPVWPSVFLRQPGVARTSTSLAMSVSVYASFHRGMERRGEGGWGDMSKRQETGSIGSGFASIYAYVSTSV